MIEACKAESRIPSNVQEKKQSKGGVNMLGLEFLKICYQMFGFFFAVSLKRKNKRKHMSDHCNLFYCTDDEICCHRSLQIIKDVWTNNSPMGRICKEHHEQLNFTMKMNTIVPQTSSRG